MRSSTVSFRERTKNVDLVFLAKQLQFFEIRRGYGHLVRIAQGKFASADTNIVSGKRLEMAF